MKNKVLSGVIQGLLVATVALLPLIFLPFFTNGYDFGKQIFLLVATLIIFVLWMVQTFTEKTFVFRKSVYFLPILGILVTSLLSTLINSTNKVQSFVSATGTGAILLSVVLFLLIVNLGKRKIILYSLLGSSAVLSLLRIILFAVKLDSPVNFPSLNLALTNAWSPTGSLLTQAVFALITIPLGFSLMYELVKQKRMAPAVIIFLANTLNLVGLGLGLHLLTSTAKPILLPQLSAWAIALEGLKNFRFAAFGLGAGQFVNSFTSFRPLSFNTSQYWSLRFGSSSNWYFHLLTEAGIIGLVAYLVFAWRVFKDGIKVFRQPRVSFLGLAAYLSLIILLITQLFIPINFFLLALNFVLAALLRDEEFSVFDFSNVGNFALLILILPVVFWGGIIFFTGKVALANNYFLSSLKATNANDGVKAYNMQIKAINADPSSSDYRITYSQTNLALANALATKQDLTDQDRSTISQLVQQAIREGKAAVAVDTRNAASWENLANLYRSLINFAEGSDQWAISAYQQAIGLDPLNPVLRVNLGGIYYSQKNWTQAANLFLQAVNLKNDYANAHYNLANSLKEAGSLADALSEYQVTQTLVAAGSDDYIKVTQELEDVKRRVAPVAPTEIKPETLSTPTVPETGIKPPLQLPNEGPVVSPAPIASPIPPVPTAAP